MTTEFSCMDAVIYTDAFGDECTATVISHSAGKARYGVIFADGTVLVVRAESLHPASQ